MEPGRRFFTGEITLVFLCIRAKIYQGKTIWKLQNVCVHAKVGVNVNIQAQVDKDVSSQTRLPSRNRLQILLFSCPE